MKYLGTHLDIWNKLNTYAQMSMQTHLPSPSEQFFFFASPSREASQSELDMTPTLCSGSYSERLFGLLPIARILIRDATQSGKTMKQWGLARICTRHDSENALTLAIAIQSYFTFL